MISAGPAGACRGPPGKSAMCLPSPGAALARGVRCTLRHGVCACDGPHMAIDLILDHGTVLDGTGRDGFPASVAVADGRIAAVGVLDGAHAAGATVSTTRPALTTTWRMPSRARSR